MCMRDNPKRAAAAIALLLIAGATGAQDANEGRIDWTMCWGGPTHLLNPAPDDRFGTYAVTGGVVAAAGPAATLSLECVGIFESRGRGGQSRGYCVFQDPAGHKIYGIDVRGAQGYTWEFLGGTGRYEGISGGGTTEVIGPMAPVRPGTLQGCRRLQGSYKLK